MAVNTTVSNIPTPPKRGVDSQTVFVTKGEAVFDALHDTVIGQMNTAFGEINTTEVNINAKEASVVSAANMATTAKDTALSSANNKGSWSLLAGSLSVPTSVNHIGTVWILNQDLIDVTLSEPSATNSDWLKLPSGFNYVYQSANYTAVANDFIYADTSVASLTVTLPATPLANDVVAILDNTSSFATNPLSVARNGKNIMGLAEDMVVDTNNISFELIYNGTEWRLR